MRLALVILLAVGAIGAAHDVEARQQADAQRPRIVAGQVVRAAPERDVPLAGVWAILHRVGSDRAGPLDSMRTDAQGRYRFRYVPAGRADAIYFVSASHGGIAYFTPPLRGDSAVGDPAEITVYDTTTKPIPLHLRGRHIVVSGSAVDGARRIVEVYELSNDTSVALVSGRDGRATWSVILPPEARGFQMGQGDVSADAATFADGRLLVYAPFPPGMKQLSFSYSLPAKAFPLSAPMPGASSVLEVLLEDSAGTVEGARLVPQQSAEIEGRRFRRWLAQDVPANAVIRIALPPRRAAARGGFISLVAALLVLAMAASLLGLRLRRRAAMAAPVRASSDEADRIAEEIAALDEAHERLARDDAAVAASARDEYERRRGELKTRLAEALAMRRGPG